MTDPLKQRLEKVRKRYELKQQEMNALAAAKVDVEVEIDLGKHEELQNLATRLATVEQSRKKKRHDAAVKLRGARIRERLVADTFKEVDALQKAVEALLAEEADLRKRMDAIRNALKKKKQKD